MGGAATVLDRDVVAALRYLFLGLGVSFGFAILGFGLAGDKWMQFDQSAGSYFVLNHVRVQILWNVQFAHH
jgi:hypothetical protein